MKPESVCDIVIFPAIVAPVTVVNDAIQALVNAEVESSTH
jgi:hypothetical protein